MEIRVMTFNVRWDGLDTGRNAWSKRRAVAVNMLRAKDPDVIGLQEPSAEQTRDLEQALDYHLAFTGGHERDRALSLLYRADRFRLDDGGSFWLVRESELEGGTRRCAWIRLVENRSGRGVYVYNVHLDGRSQASRMQAVQALAAGIRNREFDDPVIVLGDFNEPDSGPAISYLTRAAGSGGDMLLLDAYRAALPGRDRAGDDRGDTVADRRIDYVFTDPGVGINGIEVVRYQESGLFPSDHFPVLARLRLPAR